MGAMVEIKDLTKRFNDKLVTDHLSIRIEEGEVFGLLGPNGAGKSTLMNQLVGLIKSDKGEICVGGYNMAKEPMKAKVLLGLVPQEIALFGGLNAYDNLEYFGSLYGLRGKVLKEKIQEALELVGLADQGRKLVKHYSGGMKRRLNIAAATLHNPKVLIMDEPTVGIDPQSRNYIFEMIKMLNRKYKTTIIYTSHYMEEIELLCNKICIIDQGKQIAYGTKDEIKHMVGRDKVIILSVADDVEKVLFNLKQLEGVRKAVCEGNGKIKLVVRDSFVLNDLLTELVKSKVTIKNLSVEETTLEEVFLTLTGKKLRDKEA